MNRSDSRKEECQHLKQCIKTKWFNQSNLISLTGSDLPLGSLSRQMKKLRWFLSVSMFWKGAAKAAGQQLWLQHRDASCLYTFSSQDSTGGDLSNQESTCTVVFL